MKKIALTIGLAVLATGSVLYGINKNSSRSETKCVAGQGCSVCPCTPNCQPGDANCSCPLGCENK